MCNLYQTMGLVGCRKNILSLMKAVAFLCLPLIFLVSCSSRNPTEGPAPIPVVLGTPCRIQNVHTVPVSGSVVSPLGPSDVSFLVSGNVLQANPREGDCVKKGQLLASLDPTDYELVADAAAAKVEQARVALLRAEDEYRRMKFLYESKSLAPNDFEKFRATFEADRHQLDEAIAQERLARKKLSDTTLYAPVDGCITRRSIEPGDMAAAGKPVFEIARVNPVEINVGVPETDIHLVKIGQKATVTAPAMPGRSFEGTVRVINAAADPSTRTYMTRIRVPNPAGILKVGMVAEATIRGDRPVNLVTVPGEAIVRNSQGVTTVFVYYPEERRVYPRRIDTGSVYGTSIEVRKGLTGDESIVISGQDKLREGSPVSVEKAPMQEKPHG